MIIPLFFALNLARAAILHEDIGELKIHDLLIRPNFTLAEPQRGAFSIGESSFALRWELEQRYAGVVRIGPRTLINPLARFTPSVEDDLALVEGFGEYTNWFGRFRFGRLPVEWAIEGKVWERNLIFPRSLLFSQRAMMLRDVGAAYDISHDHWYTGLVIHNGESVGANSDGQIWYTARWGYKTDDWDVGLMGQTGRTKAADTQDSGDTLAGVDPTRDEKWRVGGVYGLLLRGRWSALGEYTIGEVDQATGGGKFYAGHLDGGYEWSRLFQTYLRFDVFDPSSEIATDLQQHASVAFVLSNHTHSSNLILVAMKVLDRSADSGSDEVRLIWSLSPSGTVRF